MESYIIRLDLLTIIIVFAYIISYLYTRFCFINRVNKNGYIDKYLKYGDENNRRLFRETLAQESIMTFIIAPPIIILCIPIFALIIGAYCVTNIVFFCGLLKRSAGYLLFGIRDEEESWK